MNLKKSSLCFLVIAILVLANGLNATETRVGSMGGVGFYTKDNSNIFFFPGALYSYKGQVVGELRAKNDDTRYTVGINYPLGTDKVFGIYLNRPINFTIPTGVADSVLLNYTSDLLFGMQMANYDVGFRVSLGMDGYTSGDTGVLQIDESARYLGAGVGISNEKLDFGLLFEMPSAKWERDTFSTEWGGIGFGGNARLFYGEKTQIVPLVTFYMSSTSSKESPDPDPSEKIDYSRMNLGLGVGLNHHIDDNNLLVMGLELMGMSKTKTEPKDTAEFTDYEETALTTMPALYMGVESKIKSWLIGRIGAAQVFQKVSQKSRLSAAPAVTEVIHHESQFNLSFGLGIQFGGFTLDAAINEGMFFDGPYILSGASNDMANKLSLVYKF